MEHISVLKNEIKESFLYLTSKKGAIFVDGTVGLAGHSIMLGEIFKNSDFKIIGVDQDKEALEIAGERIKSAGLESNFILIHNNFRNLGLILEQLKIAKIDGALLDLGVSSLQLDKKERGFSFSQSDELLDMRMDKDQNQTAAQILNSYPEEKLAQIFHSYGEEPFARKIARGVTNQRKRKKFITTADLIELLSKEIPLKIQKTGKTHFATRVFQALRIEVNHELEILPQAITDFVQFLNPSGRLGIISFHSLEDRLVKNTFKSLENPCNCPKHLPCVCGKISLGKIITKKPIIPSDTEVASNPRSRSAKFRIFERI